MRIRNDAVTVYGSRPPVSLGNWEEEAGDEQSQETCLYAESQICGPQIYFLAKLVFILPPRRGIGFPLLSDAVAEMRPLLYSIPGKSKKEG